LDQFIKSWSWCQQRRRPPWIEGFPRFVGQALFVRVCFGLFRRGVGRAVQWGRVPDCCCHPVRERESNQLRPCRRFPIEGPSQGPTRLILPRLTAGRSERRRDARPCLNQNRDAWLSSERSASKREVEGLGRLLGALNRLPTRKRMQLLKSSAFATSSKVVLCSPRLTIGLHMLGAVLFVNSSQTNIPSGRKFRAPADPQVHASRFARRRPLERSIQ
jgi:hypothetical protein